MTDVFGRLSKRQRKATPLSFGCYLLGGVRELCGVDRVVALWCLRNGVYQRLCRPGDVWTGYRRDAMLYDGPHPVVCHPPCGPWGNFRAWAKESREHGIAAMRHVHRWGGVVEHPAGSTLFREYGEDGVIERVTQWHFGMPCLKPTLLYWHPGRSR